MSVVAARKCVRHVAREAVARCPSCHDDFCRECVIEHAGLLYCATCLARATGAKAVPSRSRRRRASNLLLTAVSVLLLWVVFYAFGQLLKAIPAKVHEGTVWRTAVDS